MTTPSLQDEVAFISSVNANGTLAKYSFYGWNNNNPATYTSGWTSARKWGGTSAGSAGGTVSYYFNPASNWSATEKNWFAAGLALYSAVANIKFVQTTNASTAGITFNRTNDSGSYTYAIYNPGANACVTGGKVLGSISYSSVNIDTTGTSFGPINGLASQGGFSVENLLHEEGHALGLGHSGPYNGGVNVKTQQYSPYDNRRWSIMSYIDPGNTSAKYYSQTPVKGGFGSSEPTTLMPLDILAIQRLYGVATTTPLSGGQVFGFNCNISGAIRPFFDFAQNTKPVITIWDKGANNTLDLSGFTGTARVNLNPGTFSSAGGLNNNIGIAFGTKIDKLVCTKGGTNVTCNNDGDTVIGGNGGDTITGGTGNDNFQGGNGNDILNGGTGTNILSGGGGNDTAVFAGNYASYKIVHNANSTITITGNSVHDTLSAIEVLKFADKSVSAATATAAVVANGIQPANAEILTTSTQTGASLVDTTLATNDASKAFAGGVLGNLAPDALSASSDPQSANQALGDSASIGWDPSSPLLPNTPASGLSSFGADLLTPSDSTAARYATPFNAPTWFSNAGLSNAQSAWHLATM